jgi:23S rRNA pseudouridine1911/1915/1917 synthase
MSEDEEILRTQRLDQKVVELLPNLSRASTIKLIKNGRVTVNEEVETKAGYKLRTGDKINIDYDEKEASKVPDIKIPILYEDDDCVVIDKPIGLLSHSKGAFNPEATVATWLSSRTSGFDEKNDRNGIVHRLDRGTSGVMIAAKNPKALAKLQKQFSTRKAKKTYIAVIEDSLEPSEAIIDMPIERNPAMPQRFKVSVNGKAAITHYKTLKTFESSDRQFSQVELRPQTGRTHQLRVHLAYLKHPIVGDTFYEGKPAERLYLHAHKLELTLPSSERKVFTSPIPVEFAKPVLL